MHPADWINRLMKPLRAKIDALVVRGVITRVDNQKRGQSVQATGLAGQVLDPVERFEEFGFTSNPPLGTEHVTLCLRGDRSHPIMVGTLRREDRPRECAEGEACIYAVAGGTVVAIVRVKVDGTVLVRGDKLQVEGDVEVTGSLLVAGDVSDQSGTAMTMAAMRLIFNAHTHSDPQGGSVGPPATPM